MPWRVGIAAVLLLLAVGIVYLPAMRGGYVWDDDVHVTANETLAGPGGLRRIWLEPGATAQYYPLVFTSFWLERRVWGLDPAGYHAVNVLLHGLNALLVWRALHMLRVPGAWLAAGIFALHPVHVESVAWITERKNVLSGLFYLSALIAWLRFWPVDGEATRSADRRGWYAISLLLFACALLSKTVTCSLPAALLLIVWWKRGATPARAVTSLAPFFVLGLAMGMATIWIEKHHILASGDEWRYTMVERVLVAGRALWFYLGRLAAPVDLTFIYPKWEIRAGDLWPWLLPAAAAALAAALWIFRARVGRGPLAAFLFFAGTLTPALGFFDIYPMRFSFVADHFQYLASLGPIALAAAAATTLARRRGLDALVSFAGLVLLAALGALTWLQAGIYEDARTLWADTLAKNPGCWMAHNNLGLILHAQGDLDAAQRHYARALELHPRYAEAHHNAGLILGQRGDLAGARAHLAEAAAIRPDHPDTRLRLGLTLAQLGDLAGAREHLSAAAGLRPGHPDAHLNLGVVAARHGDLTEAMARFTRVLELDPGSKAAHHNIGLALARAGDLERAAAHFTEAIRIDPDLTESHRELAWIRGRQGDWPAAARALGEAVRTRPPEASLRYELGMALARAGRDEEAGHRMQEARRIDPRWPEAAARLAWLLATDADPRLRDGALAVRLSSEASAAAEAAGGSPGILDVHAAALAEAGRYEEAAAVARRAWSAAVAMGQPEMAVEIRARLRGYEAGRPYRQGAPGRSPR